MLLSGAALTAPPLPAQDSGSEGPQLNISPSFQLKFNGSHNYLQATLVIINASGLEMRNLTITQKFPDNFVPAAASDAIHEFFLRPDGFEEKIDGPLYTMTVPSLHRRELTTGFVQLNYRGRPSEAEIAPAEVTYTAGGATRKETGPPQKLDLGKYTKYSGTLPDYLKRYAGIQIRIPDSSAGDWGFSSLAYKVRARSPLGVIEIDGDATEGRFSLMNGAPGDLKEILVAWKPDARAKPAGSPEEIRKLINDQVMAAADFTFDLAPATVEKGSFARGEAWALATTWKDRVLGRLGEGPMKWYVYDDPQRSTQYIIMIRAQGRGAGAGKADVPQPEKEAALMKELEEIVRSFRPV
jgi:hypothetical protein